MDMKKLMVAAIAVAASAAAVAEPMAAVVVTDITGGITNQTTPITAVASASLGLAVVLIAFRWIRRAMR